MTIHFRFAVDHTPFDGFTAGLMTHYVRSNIIKNKGVWPHALISHSQGRKKRIYHLDH